MGSPVACAACDLTDTHTNVLRLEVARGELDYYVIAGPQPADVIARYTELVGRMPLPPRWALGYHQSRYSYYPADVDYMDGYRVFTWDLERFPDPRGLTGDLAEQGFKLVTIIDPCVKYQPEGGYPVYGEGHERGYFIRDKDTGEEWSGFVWAGRCVLPDFVRADVRRWWGDLHRELVEDGVRGIWND